MARIINLEDADEYKARGAVMIKRPTWWARWYLRSSYLLRSSLSKLAFWATLNLFIIALVSLWALYKVKYEGVSFIQNHPTFFTDETLLIMTTDRFAFKYDAKEKACYPELREVK